LYNIRSLFKLKQECCIINEVKIYNIAAAHLQITNSSSIIRHISFIIPFNNALLVYIIVAVANRTIPITAVLTDIKVVLTDTNLVLFNNTRLEMIQQIERQRSQTIESLQISDNYVKMS
jgi:hypothetical protein